jgi:hypothetical protein
MNRFIIEETPQKCAQSHCDKHVPKMYVEEGQMLSTVHRLLDGTEERRPSKSGKTMQRYWKLPDLREDILYAAVHVKHPCTLWAMETAGNYKWAYQMFLYLGIEYNYRYNKYHKTDELDGWLCLPPDNINPSEEVTPMPLAMGANPECMNPDDVMGSYRKFYQTKQERFKMVWSKRPVPEWFEYSAA